MDPQPIDTESSDSIHFGRPPVVEVVLAVAFAPMPEFTAAHIGSIWSNHFREDFPKAREVLPYDPPVESAERSAPTINLTLRDAPPAPRLWFISSDDTQLLQIQNNWLALNWRKQDSDSEYPRYDELRPQFAARYKQFDDALQELQMGPIHPTQCELTYINRFSSSEIPNAQRLNPILNIIRFDDESRYRAIEEAALRMRFKIDTAEDGHIGRLHVSFDPVRDAGTNELLAIGNFTARGAPLSKDLSGVVAFLDRAHKFTLDTFLSMTAPAMHEQWEIQYD